MQVAAARMERQLAAGMDLDALYGLSERELAGMEVEDDDDADADEDPVAAAGADAELDAPPGMRLEDLGGSEVGPGSSAATLPGDSGVIDAGGFTSSKEVGSGLAVTKQHPSFPWHACELRALAVGVGPMYTYRFCGPCASVCA